MAEESESRESDPLLAALDRVLQANRATQQALIGNEERTLRYIARVRAGDRVVDMAREGLAAERRTELNAAMADLIAARQGSRHAIFRQLVADGMTRKEIAAIWGFSQQVVSRIVNYEDGPT
jgi:hypothetical protein